MYGLVVTAERSQLLWVGAAGSVTHCRVTHFRRHSPAAQQKRAQRATRVQHGLPQEARASARREYNTDSQFRSDSSVRSTQCAYTISVGLST